MWKKLASKILLDHPRLKVLEDEVELPNGHTTQYLKFDSGGSAVTVIAVNEEGKILLQKEYSYPPNEELYQFPGGFVPHGENLLEGANRELMEEADLKANSLVELGSYYINNRRSNSKMYVYLASDLQNESLTADAEEDIKSYWFSEAEIDELIKKGDIKNYSVLAAWSLYKLR
jgi:ADP-ribose pyrophosphatase